MYDGFNFKQYSKNWQPDNSLHPCCIRFHVTDKYLNEFKKLDKITLSEICISGLDQKSFDYFIGNYASKFSVIEILHCPKISDFSPFATLENIEYIIINWNTLAQQLWDMSCNLKLKGIYLEETKKIVAFPELSTAPVLEEVLLTEGVNSSLGSNKWVINTLNDFSSVVNLKRLMVTISKVADNDIKPILLMKHLDLLHFASNLFTLEDFARINVALINTSVTPDKPFYTYANTDDVLVIGKSRSVKKNSPKLTEYQKQWNDIINNNSKTDIYDGR